MPGVFLQKQTTRAFLDQRVRSRKLMALLFFSVVVIFRDDLEVGSFYMCQLFDGLIR